MPLKRTGAPDFGFDAPERFARSLVRLALARNGYEVQVGQGNQGSAAPDLIAHGVRDGKSETFGVEVKWVGPGRRDRDVRDRATALSSQLGVQVYAARVHKEGERLTVDRALKDRMLYSSAELKVSALPERPEQVRDAG